MEGETWEKSSILSVDTCNNDNTVDVDSDTEEIHNFNIDYETLNQYVCYDDLLSILENKIKSEIYIINELSIVGDNTCRRMLKISELYKEFFYIHKKLNSNVVLVSNEIDNSVKNMDEFVDIIEQCGCGIHKRIDEISNELKIYRSSISFVHALAGLI